VGLILSSEPAERPIRADAQRNRARILDAALAVFTEGGPQASTEDVAARAGVAIGTVFRHFPTKADLLRALLKRVLAELTAEAADLVATGDPATALFAFFELLVERTSASRAAVALLAGEGVAVSVADSISALDGTVRALLERAQACGAVRSGVRPDEVLALLDATCQGALRGGWDADLRHRTLAVVFTGLAPGPDPGHTAGTVSRR
jgi:AcrR family transcriptional regulator